MRKLVLLLMAALICIIAACSSGNANSSPPASPIEGAAAGTDGGNASGGASPSETAPTGEAQGEDTPSSIEAASPTGEMSAGNSPDANVPTTGQTAKPEAEPSKAPGKASPQPSPSKPASTQPPASQPSPTQPPTEKPTPDVEDAVTFTVTGNAEWGAIIPSETVVLKEGDTAASVLKRVAKAHRLSFEIRGSGALTYIEGIDGLYEFDDGPTSGWKYRVNGEVPDIGAGVYELKPGDRLEWFYTSEDEAAAEGKKLE